MELSDPVSNFKVHSYQKWSEIGLHNCPHKLLKSLPLVQSRDLGYISPLQKENTENRNIPEDFPSTWEWRWCLIADWVKNVKSTLISTYLQSRKLKENDCSVPRKDWQLRT